MKAQLSMKIVHLILGLGSGGAENMLLKLTKEIHTTTDVSQTILTLTSENKLLNKFNENGIEVINLTSEKKLSYLFLLPRLISLLIKKNPDVLQCWMYHAEFFGLFAKLFYWRKFKLIWNIRRSKTDWKEKTLFNKVIFFFLKVFSKIPYAIISNTQEGILNHLKAGYKNKNIIKIENGFVIPPKTEKIDKEQYFLENNISLNDKTIVMVARINEVKDHKTAIKAFELMQSDTNYSNTTLVIIGKTDDQKLYNEITASKNKDKICFIGEIDNVLGTISIFDIGTLTSKHEGFPNVIGEYILAGIPVVSTNVGEVKNILGNHGILTEVGDYTAICNGWKTILNHQKEWEKKVEKNQQDLIDSFSIEVIAKKYLNLYYAK